MCSCAAPCEEAELCRCPGGGVPCMPSSKTATQNREACQDCREAARADDTSQKRISRHRGQGDGLARTSAAITGSTEQQYCHQHGCLVVNKGNRRQSTHQTPRQELAFWAPVSCCFQFQPIFMFDYDTGACEIERSNRHFVFR